MLRSRPDERDGEDRVPLSYELTAKNRGSSPSGWQSPAEGFWSAGVWIRWCSYRVLGPVPFKGADAVMCEMGLRWPSLITTDSFSSAVV